MTHRVLEETEQRIVMQALADYDQARSLDSAQAGTARRLYGELHDGRLVIESVADPRVGP